MSDHVTVANGVNPVEGHDLDHLVACRVFGLRSKTVQPDWYPVPVTLYFYREEYIEFSWDKRSCNAMMFCDQARASGPSAPPLPGFSSDGDHLSAIMDCLKERGCSLILGHRPQIERKGWFASVNARGVGPGYPDTVYKIATTPQLALCLAAVAALEDQETDGRDSTRPLPATEGKDAQQGAVYLHAFAHAEDVARLEAEGWRRSSYCDPRYGWLVALEKPA